MWIALSIIAALIIIISTLLFVPFHLLIKNEDGQTHLYIRILFIKVDPIKISQKMSSKNKKPNRFVKWIKKAFSKKHPPVTKQEKSFFEKITDAVEAIKTVIGVLKELIKKIKIKKLHIKAITADNDAADAALEYGKLCAVVYPAVSFLQTLVRVDEKGIDIFLGCDFNAENPVFEIETDIVFNLFGVLSAFVKYSVSKGETK